MQYLFAKSKNHSGTDMQIIEYQNSSDITVKFLDGSNYQTNSTLQRFKKRSIKNPYDKTMYGVGWLGEGKYMTTENDVTTKVFYYWSNMMKRCYSKVIKESNRSYYGVVTVCEEWHNFQNFAEWFYGNIYEYDGGRLHIDKDILVNGNKVYAPDKCLIVPQRINMIFMSKPNADDLPSGLKKFKYGYYVIYNGKPVGRAVTLEDAVKLHDTHQQKHVRKVAEEFRSVVPEKIYNALMNWTPESLAKS